MKKTYSERWRDSQLLSPNWLLKRKTKFGKVYKRKTQQGQEVTVKI